MSVSTCESTRERLTKNAVHRGRPALLQTGNQSERTVDRLLDQFLEAPLPFADVSKLFPHAAATSGQQSVVESIQMGGKRCSTREAVRRFCERLTNRDRPTATAAPRNSKATAKATAYLDREGV
jgi:hypothetical protein